MTVLKTRKFWMMLALTAALCLLASVVYAKTPGSGLSGLNDGNAFVNFFKTLAEKFVEQARNIITFLVVVVIVWGGLLMIPGAADSNIMTASKQYFKYSIVALFVVILADKIVGFFLGLSS